VRQRLIVSYKVALEQVPVARKLAAKHDILFTRPTDYYAEMVKSDEHMERIRTKLVDEAYVLSLLDLHDTDNTDKASRSPKLPNDSGISRNTENRFKFKRSNRGRWTRSLSRTRSKVSRGVRLSTFRLSISLTRQRGTREQSSETSSTSISIIPRKSLSEVVLLHEAHEEGVARQV